MSRTDAHAPYAVRVVRREIAVLADHDCAGQECDLPALEPGWADTRTRCRWEFAYTGTSIRSCWMCHCHRSHALGAPAAQHSESHCAPWPVIGTVEMPTPRSVCDRWMTSPAIAGTGSRRQITSVTPLPSNSKTVAPHQIDRHDGRLNSRRWRGATETWPRT